VPVGQLCWMEIYAPPLGIVGKAADVVEIQATNAVMVVVPPGLKETLAQTSQSPAVNEIDVTFMGTLVVIETAEPTKTVDEMISPISPAAALSFVAVPVLMPVSARRGDSA
jgi:UDP-N-acetyl-D-mannosaminuronate dehydrogenase